MAVALARGARRALEVEHMRHVERLVESNVRSAHMGSNPGRLSRVRGYLRLLADRARLSLPLDEAEWTPEHRWQEVYLCLRSGLAEEALRVLGRHRDVLGCPELSLWLEEWVARGGVVRPHTAKRVGEQCLRLMTAAVPLQQRNVHALLLHVLVAGDVEMHDRFLAEYRHFFVNIEDFLWFKLGLVRRYDASRTGIDYSVADMQRALNQFGPHHYSRDGVRPLLYATVLVCSLQFHAAVDFILHDPIGAQGHAVDAVHVAIALQNDGLFDAAPPLVNVGVAEGAWRLNAAAVVHAYARQQFLERFGGDASVLAALDYMVTAAACSPDPWTAGVVLLQELVTTTHAYGLLLGPGEVVTLASPAAQLAGAAGTDTSTSTGAGVGVGAGAGASAGAGARHPTPASTTSTTTTVSDVRRMVEQVAERCLDAAQNEAATELFLSADRPEAALVLLVGRVSDLIASAPAHDLGLLCASLEFRELERRGKAACARVVARDPTAAVVNDFQTLLCVARLLEADRRQAWGVAGEVLRSELLVQYVPERVEEVGMCLARARGSAVVRGHLDSVLQATARVLEAELRMGGSGVGVRVDAVCEVAGGLQFARACELLVRLGRTVHAGAGGGEGGETYP